MVSHLHIVLWNANGLARHTEELKAYLTLRDVDIMLISETHFTTKIISVSQTIQYTTPSTPVALLMEGPP